MRRGSISSEMIMCGRGARSILILPLVARCLEKCMCVHGACFLCVCCSDCVGMFVV